MVKKLRMLTLLAALLLVAIWAAGGFAAYLTVLCAGILAANVCVAMIARNEASALNGRLLSAKRKAQEEQESARAERAKLEKECGERIARFHSELSHGLRMPISIIQGYAEILSGDLVIDEAARGEYLQKIGEQASYMGDLLGQMLMQARGGQQPIAELLEQIDILELLRRVAEQMSLAFQRKNIEVRIVSTEETIPILADVLQMNKIFYNILENALKYMGRPGTVNITCAYGNDDEVLIVVKDDGAGLASEEVDHIFELNYQGSNKNAGYGLGLHLAKMVVETRGGSISAKSSPDRGMGIYITLPAIPRKPGAAPVREAATAGAV